MSVQDYPSVDLLRQLVRYEGGKVFWLTRPRNMFQDDNHWKGWNKRFAGKEAGRLVDYGDRVGRRWIIRFRGLDMRRALVVWALYHDEWRIGLDHENGDSVDDRIENLRIATGTQNGANKRRQSNNTSGYKGVTWNRDREKWVAQIQVQGRHKTLGYFDNPVAAHAVYMRAAREYYGEFACGGDREAS